MQHRHWTSNLSLTLIAASFLAACASGGATEPMCGDTILTPDEDCDDGNLTSGDGCAPDCRFESVPACGNGALEATENCDDGNTVACDGCTDTCVLEACGNGILECDEECDDGNTADGDGCAPACTIEIPANCGDDIVDPGEECDDGNNVSGDGCQANCLLPACGDGFMDPGEECDDGNDASGDGCSDACIIEGYTHTIAIDGTNDFGAQEVFATSTQGFISYISWDGSAVYLGLSASDVASGDPGKWILAYFSGIVSSQSGVTYNTQAASLPFAAGYHLRWKADESYIDLQAYDGAGWASIGYAGDWQRDGSFVEISIPLIDIGEPKNLDVHLNMINEQDLAEWSWSAIPETSFTDGYNPEYSRYYSFDLTSPAVPNSYSPLP